jgi:hypothetical protein
MGEPFPGPGADRSLIFQHPSLYPWLSALDIDSVAFGLRLEMLEALVAKSGGSMLSSICVRSGYASSPTNVRTSSRAVFVERLRSEVTKGFQEQELEEMLDTRLK